MVSKSQKVHVDTPAWFLSTDPNNSYLFNKNILSKLKNFEGGASKDFMLYAETTRPKFPKIYMILMSRMLVTGLSEDLELKSIKARS